MELIYLADLAKPAAALQTVVEGVGEFIILVLFFGPPMLLREG